VIEHRPATAVTREEILSCASSLTGEQSQRPPLYSALKIKGKRASDRVRNGEQVDIAARKVTVFDFDVLDFDRENARFSFRVHCTKGTYVRSLARDIGGLLGTGGHVESLRRIGAGIFSIEDAVDFSGLEDYVRRGTADRHFCLRPEEALADYGRIIVDDTAAGRARNGAVFTNECALKIDDKGGKTFIITDIHENLIAIADVDIREWQIKYLNVFNTILK
jgi:tRNA pseudouridine55 synthase